MKTRVLIALLLLPTSARAAGEECRGREVHVEDGEGLTMALDDAQPGDRIIVHEGQQPYQGFQTAPGSGTSEQPICLVAAEGESPVFAGQVKFNGASYWIFEGLTLVGGTTRGFQIRSQTTRTQGVVIRNNRIFDVPGPGIKSGVPLGEPGPENDGMPTDGTLIENNHIYGSTTLGIEVTSGSGVIVRDNVIEDVRCGNGQQRGVLVGSTAEDARVVGNTVRLSAGCSAPAGVSVSGIDLRGVAGVEVERNLVEVASNPEVADLHGIIVRRGTTGAVITGNIVRGQRGVGLADADEGDVTAGSVWTHNTVVDVDVGVSIIGTDARFESNLVVATALAVRLDAEAVAAGTSLRGNVLFADAQMPFELGGQALDAQAWAADCGCDEDNAFEMPELAPDGVTPRSPPALDGAEGSTRTPITGAQADIGALETPMLLDAEVSDDGMVVTASFEVAGGPLRPGGCEGVQVRRNGARVPLAACTWANDVLTLELLEPLGRGDEAEFLAPALYDSADIGGIGAAVVPSRYVLETAALPEVPEATGTSTGAGETEGAEDTDAPGQTPPPDTGCGCRSNGGHGWVALVFLLAGFSRRRIRRA